MRRFVPVVAFLIAVAVFATVWRGRIENSVTHGRSARKAPAAGNEAERAIGASDQSGLGECLADTRFQYDCEILILAQPMNAPEESICLPVPAPEEPPESVQPSTPRETGLPKWWVFVS